ncbi:MAG TPA: FHA domain-containing protein [Thermoanaerobaculia bacterium]|nr:FHA domain-containing protein [Thermoanaerobaculia bacterium]
MIIECSHCHARYEYDSARFAGKPSRKIRCARCSEIFEILNPEQASAGTPANKEAADNTMVRGRRSYAGTSRDAIPEIEDEEPESSADYAAPLELPKDKRFSLAITDGADAARVFRIDRARVTLGRSGADITLNDVETSREHAAIEVRGGVVYLEDLGSTNGTFAGGSRITQPVEIHNHQEFIVGTTTLMLIVTALE